MFSSVPKPGRYMLPADLAAERERRVRRAYSAFAGDFRHAMTHATDAEKIGLMQLAKDCLARTITPDEAREHVLRLRRTQNERSRQAA